MVWSSVLLSVLGSAAVPKYFFPLALIFGSSRPRTRDGANRQLRIEAARMLKFELAAVGQARKTRCWHLYIIQCLLMGQAEPLLQHSTAREAELFTVLNIVLRTALVLVVMP